MRNDTYLIIAGALMLLGGLFLGGPVAQIFLKYFPGHTNKMGIGIFIGVILAGIGFSMMVARFFERP